MRNFIQVNHIVLQKGTKNSLETGRTFATIFADMDFRQCLLGATSEAEFKRLIISHSQELAEEQQISHDKRITINQSGLEDPDFVSIKAIMICSRSKAQTPAYTGNMTLILVYDSISISRLGIIKCQLTQNLCTYPQFVSLNLK